MNISILFCFLCNIIGSLFIFFKFNKRFINIINYISIGIILSTSIFSIFIPIFNMNKFISIIFFILGFFIVFNKFYFSYNFNSMLLFVVANIIHNIPEGLVILSGSFTIPLSIGLQNIGDSIMFSSYLLCHNINKERTFIYSLLCSLSELLSSIVGYLLINSIDFINIVLFSFSSSLILFSILFELFNYKEKDSILLIILSFIIVSIIEIIIN